MHVIVTVPCLGCAVRVSLNYQVKQQKGVINWKELLECDVRLPVDPKQMPDTFIYLCRGTKGNDR